MVEARQATPPRWTDPGEQSFRLPRVSRKHTRDLAGLYDAYDGQTIDVSFRELVGPLAADEYTHGIFPYPARLLRHIPRLLLSAEQLVKDVQCVVDPFAGSGTVLLEAQLRGLRAHGVDQNPVAVLISRLKTTLQSFDGIEDESDRILALAKRSRKCSPPVEFLSRWYSSGAISALSRLSAQIHVAHEQWRDFLQLSLVLAARRVAQTDPRIPVPVRHERNRSIIPDDVWTAWKLSVDSLARRIRSLPKSRPQAHVLHADARHASTWSAISCSDPTLILTSPPYGAAQKYIRSSSLDLGWLGFASDRGTADLERTSIGREHLSKATLSRQVSIDSDPLDASLAEQLTRIANRSPVRAVIYREYFTDMRQVLQQAVGARPVRIALITGTNNVAGETVETYRHLGVMLVAMGFNRTLSLRDPIKGRSLLTTRRGGVPSPSEFIEIFESGF